MSTYLYTVFPTDPGFVPNRDARPRALAWFRDFVLRIQDPKDFMPDFEDHVDDEISVILPSESQEFVRCPHCHADLESSYAKLIGQAYDASRFRDLDIKMPCCGRIASLNALDALAPIGFCSYRLEAEGANISQFAKAGEIEPLERILGCKLRQTLVHL